MIVTREVWRTADGRLVEFGSTEGAFVAYTRGTEVSDSQVEKLGLAAFVAPKLAPMRRVPPGAVVVPVAVEPEAVATPSENPAAVLTPTKQPRAGKATFTREV